MSLLDHYAEQLDQLRQQGNFRQFRSNQQQGKTIEIQQQQMLNLSSNDYLGLAADLHLREQFFDETPNAQRWMSSSSSRLLTGNFAEYEQLEASLSQAFHVRSIPTLVLMNKTNEIGRISGALRSSELQQWLDQQLQAQVRS